MREIKFRAFGGNTMGVVTGFDDQFSSVKWGNDEVSCDVVTEDIRLMQYTGMKDKDGREIYEGDILKRGHEKKPHFYAVIEFHKGGFVGVTHPGGKYRIELSRLHYCDYDLKGYDTIVGNIYENPELIEYKPVAAK